MVRAWHFRPRKKVENVLTPYEKKVVENAGVILERVERFEKWAHFACEFPEGLGERKKKVSEEPVRLSPTPIEEKDPQAGKDDSVDMQRVDSNL